jgi:anti-sigma factor RsiW
MEEDADATRPPEACGDTHGRGRRDPGALARRPTTAQALAPRARIVLACATGQPDTVIASEARVNRLTVGRWRRRFLAKGAAVATQEFYQPRHRG